MIGSLRLDPERPDLRVRAGSVKVTGPSGRHALVLALRNSGNTAEPITGQVTLAGAFGRRQSTLHPVRIVPRRLAHLTLGTYRGLLRGWPAGRYTLAVTLSQGGRVVLRTTRVVRLT